MSARRAPGECAEAQAKGKDAPVPTLPPPTPPEAQLEAAIEHEGSQGQGALRVGDKVRAREHVLRVADLIAMRTPAAIRRIELERGISLSRRRSEHDAA